MTSALLSAVLGSVLLGFLSAIALLAATAVRHALSLGRAPLIAAARAEIAAIAAMATLGATDRETLDEKSLDQGEPATPPTPNMRRLTRGEQVSVLLALAPSVGGGSLSALLAVATDLGLIAHARRHLASRRWSTRLQAARFLTAMGLHCGQLGSALFTDSHPAVRVQAAVWASSCTGVGPIERVVALLNDEDGYCRFAAKDTLVRIGIPAIPTIDALLESEDQVMLTAGLEVAAAMSDPSFSDHATGIAASGTTRQRALAAKILGTSGGQVTGAVLRGLLHDPQAAVRKSATIALAGQGDWSAAASVAELLEDPVWDVRREAALALLKLGAPGIIMLRDAARGEGQRASIATQVLELRTLHTEARRG